MGRPSEAKALRLGWVKVWVSVAWGSGGEPAGRAEKPRPAVKAARSRAWPPRAMAGRGEGLEAVLIIPNGRLSREKAEVAGMGCQDSNFGIFEGVVI